MRGSKKDWWSLHKDYSVKTEKAGAEKTGRGEGRRVFGGKLKTRQ